MSELILSFVNLLATFLWIAILARVILSWIQISPSSSFYPIVTVVFQVTEPILAPIRRILPSMGMIDLSPMIAIIVITIIQRVLISALG